MEQKIKALKISSKVISIITKISYIVSIVMMSICAAMLIFLAVTGGKTSLFTIGGTNIIAFDSLSTTPSELAARCAVLIVSGGMFLAIFLLINRMFQEISLTGKPFEKKYAKTLRVVGILTAAMPFVVGLADGIATAFSGTEIPDMYTDIPGLVVGAIIFCLSYIIDYGCGLEEKSGTSCDVKAGE